jgi:hypothetical protein
MGKHTPMFTLSESERQMMEKTAEEWEAQAKASWKREKELRKAEREAQEREIMMKYYDLRAAGTTSAGLSISPSGVTSGQMTFPWYTGVPSTTTGPTAAGSYDLFINKTPVDDPKEPPVFIEPALSVEQERDFYKTIALRMLLGDLEVEDYATPDGDKVRKVVISRKLEMQTLGNAIPKVERDPTSQSTTVKLVSVNYGPK